MNGTNISMTVAALANFISQNYTNEQIDLLAAIFTQLGDTLAAIASANALCCNNQ